jgi:hypothetical protein
MNIYDEQLAAHRLALRESVRKWGPQQTDRVSNVAIFGYSQAAIRRTEHMDQVQCHPLPWQIIWSARTLVKAGTKVEIHWVQGENGIPRYKAGDRQANRVGAVCCLGTVRDSV